jgi:hypothetical protein
MAEGVEVSLYVGGQAQRQLLTGAARRNDHGTQLLWHDPGFSGTHMARQMVLQSPKLSAHAWAKESRQAGLSLKPIA